ncbi:MAG: hypothetical protein JSS36_08570 [Proteobacteria bacterium]|nr:hypothetical protein [Pseudomonadota bacterium]
MPMLWAFFGIAVAEMLAVHLFVVLKWPWLAWPLTWLTALSLVWLVGWIRSWARLPHELADGQLHLHMGSLRSIAVPIAQVARVVRQVDAARLAQPGTRKLVPLAYPNRIVELAEPLPGRRRTRALAIRLDDPAAFDAALAGQGIAID